MWSIASLRAKKADCTGGGSDFLCAKWLIFTLRATKALQPYYSSRVKDGEV
uniref:Uncharacterized protein n=1 Tax=Burkholderia sp. STW8-4 TaxID=1699190 RepID=A0A2Z6IU15_9BURK|nr:hypothetical protein [Burkholderia sp. STW8-4]